MTLKSLERDTKNPAVLTVKAPKFLGPASLMMSLNRLSGAIYKAEERQFIKDKSLKKIKMKRFLP